MRIPRERTNARLRITQTQVLIEEAVEKAIKELPDLTDAEIMLALIETTRIRADYHVRSETPIKGD